MTTTLSEGQLNVQYTPFLRVRSAIFACYVIKCEQCISADRQGSHTYFFNPIGPIMLVPIIAFSRVVVESYVIYVNLMAFS